MSDEIPNDYQTFVIPTAWVGVNEAVGDTSAIQALIDQATSLVQQANSAAASAAFSANQAAATATQCQTILNQILGSGGGGGSGGGTTVDLLGGTGQTGRDLMKTATPTAAKTVLALENVDNTSDATKLAGRLVVGDLAKQHAWCVGDVMITRPITDTTVRVVWHKATPPAGGGYPNAVARDGWELWNG